MLSLNARFSFHNCSDVCTCNVICPKIVSYFWRLTGPVYRAVIFPHPWLFLQEDSNRDFAVEWFGLGVRRLFYKPKHLTALRIVTELSQKGSSTFCACEVACDKTSHTLFWLPFSHPTRARKRVSFTSLTQRSVIDGSDWFVMRSNIISIPGPPRHKFDFNPNCTNIPAD